MGSRGSCKYQDFRTFSSQLDTSRSPFTGRLARAQLPDPTGNRIDGVEAEQLFATLTTVVLAQPRVQGLEPLIDAGQDAYSALPVVGTSLLGSPPPLWGIHRSRSTPYVLRTAQMVGISILHRDTTDKCTCGPNIKCHVLEPLDRKSWEILNLS